MIDKEYVRKRNAVETRFIKHVGAQKEPWRPSLYDITHSWSYSPATNILRIDSDCGGFALTCQGCYRGDKATMFVVSGYSVLAGAYLRGDPEYVWLWLATDKERDGGEA